MNKTRQALIKDCFAYCKAYFQKHFRDNHPFPYQFDLKDGVALKEILRKVYNLMIDKCDKEYSVEDLNKGFEFFIDNINYEFIINNFTLPMINSKFNEIMIAMRTGGTKADKYSKLKKKLIFLI